MKLLLPICLLLLSFFACKKDSPPKPMGEVSKVYKDSVSFTVDEKKFQFLDVSREGFGNRQINIKPSHTIKVTKKPHTKSEAFIGMEKKILPFSIPLSSFMVMGFTVI